MKYTVGDVYDVLNKFAPFETAESWDNVGLLIGGRGLAVSGIFLSLDCTSSTLELAAEVDSNLIITHHPVIFSPMTHLDSSSTPYKAAAMGISVISAHTNLDIAQGGVNDALAELLELSNIRPLTQPQDMPANGLSLGRLGELEHSLTPKQLAEFVCGKLGAKGLSYTGCSELISTVAVCGGAGGSLLSTAKQMGAQALITGEAKHSHLLEAAELDIALIAGGHFATEVVVLPTLHKLLSDALPQVNIQVSSQQDEGARFISL